MARFISDDEMNKLAPEENSGPRFISDDEMLGLDKGPDVSMLESGARGLAQGASLGFADEITGGLESLLSDKTYQQARDESRRNYDSARAANPGTYTTGEIGGALGTAFIPGLGAANGGRIGLMAAKGALAGGLGGLGTSDSDLIEGDYAGAAKDTLKGTALGGTLGAAIPLAGKGMSRLAESDAVRKLTGKVAGTFDDFAESQAARALGAERGTIKKLGADKVKEIGRHALDERIISPLASTDDMISRNSSVMSRGGNMMDEAYSAIDDVGASTFNPQNVAEKVNEELGGFWRSPLNKGETNQFENTLEAILMRGDGNIPLREAQLLKRELGNAANWKNNLNITPKEQMARDAYGIVSSSIDEAAETGAKEIGKEGLLSTLQKGKSLFGKSKGAETLLDNRLAREQGNKMFGLTDTIAGTGSVAAMGPSGLGVLAAKKGLEKFGNATSAVGANNIAKMVKETPQLLGKFANVLQQAESRGPNGIAATHFILQQTNPDYRQTLMRAAGEDQSERDDNN